MYFNITSLQLNVTQPCVFLYLQKWLALQAEKQCMNETKKNVYYLVTTRKQTT